jgi:hypothetical protein
MLHALSVLLMLICIMFLKILNLILPQGLCVSYLLCLELPPLCLPWMSPSQTTSSPELPFIFISHVCFVFLHTYVVTWYIHCVNYSFTFIISHIANHCMSFLVWGVSLFCFQCWDNTWHTKGLNICWINGSGIGIKSPSSAISLGLVYARLPCWAFLNYKEVVCYTHVMQLSHCAVGTILLAAGIDSHVMNSLSVTRHWLIRKWIEDPNPSWSGIFPLTQPWWKQRAVADFVF